MRPRVDHRARAFMLAAAGIATLGAMIALWPSPHTPAQVDTARAPVPQVAPETPVLRVDPAQRPAAHEAEARAREIRARFQQGVIMLHAGEYDNAAQALHRLLELAPEMPEAHVNLGFAFLGLKEHAMARDFFASALELRPSQTNAYYGLAQSLKALGDDEAALGAMRSFVHLSDAEDPFLRKAEAALWEWEQRATTDPAQ